MSGLPRVFACIALFLLFFFPSSQSTAADNAACAANKAALAKIDTAIGQMDAADVPMRVAAEMGAVLDQLIAALNATEKDLESITSPVNTVMEKFEQAKEKVDTVNEMLSGSRSPIPRSVAALSSKLDGFAQSVANGIERYKDSPVGLTGAGLDKAREYIKSSVEKLESVKTALQSVNALDDARNGTGAEQIRAMKFMFDQLKGTLALDEVPGLGAMLDAYSEAMDGIANSVDTIERTLKERVRMADEALRDTDFGNMNALYPGLQSPREKAQARLSALRTQQATLQGERAAAECDKPPPPIDPCVAPDGQPEKMRRLIEGRSRALRTRYEEARGDYRELMARLSVHALNQPALRTEAPDGAMQDYAAALNQLRRAARSNDQSSYGGRDPLADIKEMAGTLQVDLPPAARDWVMNANTYLPLLSAALEGRVRQSGQRMKMDLDQRMTVWQDDMRRQSAATQAAADRLATAKAALEREVGDTIVQESRAQGWDKAQTELYDRCFPAEARLRRASESSLSPVAVTPPTPPRTLGPCTGPDAVPLDRSLPILRAHKDLIETGRRNMNRLYQNANYGGTSDERLAAEGFKATDHQTRHRLRWAWSGAGERFYTRHSQKLDSIVRADQARGCSLAPEFNRVGAGMTQWQAREARIQALYASEYQKMVGLFRAKQPYGEGQTPTSFDPERLLQGSLF